MRQFVFISADEQTTERLGGALAARLPAGATVALDGPLGAGKTRLVQAVAHGCGVDRRDVVSPTFVLAHCYQGRRTIHHLDAYRLSGGDEFLDLGVGELFAGDDLVFVEWAEKVAECLPDERLDLRITVLDLTSRRCELTARGERYERVLDEISNDLAGGANERRTSVD